MVRIGIAGGAGYTAGELIRILLGHPEAEIVFVNSESHAGDRVADVHGGLIGETELEFTAKSSLDEIDVLFLCLGHGKSREYLENHNLPAGLRVIDFAQDFRLKEATPVDGETWVYGLPELNREKIAVATHVANPGCFATCIELSLLPLASAGLLKGTICVNALTGSTGSGQKPTATTHFSWRNGNISVYKAFRHQHLAEILQTLSTMQADTPVSIDFIPYRGNFTRGIFMTAVLHTDATMEEVESLYLDFYKDSPFSHYSRKEFDLKQVIGTNKCICHAEVIDGRLLVIAAIDNLLKGASGQAVENMNLMFGLPETSGLKLKAIAF